jgi:glycosyltransferase involved in cell wall biosynthesis
VSRRPRLLWVGDAVVTSGFARVAHNVLAHLSASFDVAMLGINFFGDPGHGYPYEIWPAATGGDMWGWGRLAEVVAAERPDAVLVNNDPPVVAKFVEARNEKLPQPWPKLLGYMPIDGPGMHRAVGKALCGLDCAIFYTRFGADVAARSGFDGDAAIIPHGVDRALYRPLEPAACRAALGLDPAAFYVANVNRNQPRKRIDLTLSRFSEWVASRKLPPSVRLLLHMTEQDHGWPKLREIAGWFGIADRIEITQKGPWHKGIPEARMPLVYGASDVGLTTTLGEGWGLTTMEGMAGARAQIAPSWSALAEWAAPGARLVPCHDLEVLCGQQNSMGGVIGADELFAALDDFYFSAEKRAAQAAAGLALVSAPTYSWEAVAERFRAVLEQVLAGESSEKEGEQCRSEAMAAQ